MTITGKQIINGTYVAEGKDTFNSFNVLQGKPIETLFAEATDEEVDYAMLITTVETKTHFYKILCWTLKENRDKLQKDFITIASSLKD